ncbi:MAG: S41 family peptidase [Pseudomonadota bacterium]
MDLVRKCLFIAFLLLPSVAMSQTAAARQQLDAQATLADIDLAEQALSALHAGYDRYLAREALDQLWSDVRARSQDGLTRGELYFHISRVLAEIRCDHTKAELPKDIEDERQRAPLYLPFRFQFFERRMYVTQAAEGIALDRGAEIVSIDGRPVADLIDAVSSVFPVDGDTDYIKAHSIANFGEFMGPAFEHFMPFVYTLKPDAELQLRGEGGDLRTLVVPRIGFEAYAGITGEARYSRNFVDAVRFETLGDDAGYLAVDTFINYRKPVDPDDLYAPVFKRMREEGRDKLIIDLRRNGGGSNDAAWGLFRWLINAPIQPTPEIWTRFDRIEPELREHLSTWDERVLKPKPRWFRQIDNGYYKLVSKLAGAPWRKMKPKRGAFDGEIIMLTSYDNASGVTHLLSALKGIDRAMFVGEPTGGASTGATAGYIAFLTLPNSAIKIRIPLQRTIMANSDRLDPRGGIRPDVEVLQTRESYFAGEDPALATAKRLFGVVDASP